MVIWDLLDRIYFRYKFIPHIPCSASYIKDMIVSISSAIYAMLGCLYVLTETKGSPILISIAILLI